ncbi:MAG TPA: hypothetical protein ENI88_14420 [Desulfobulbus sp.]|nr:hypothetical protein [Desulfobulbus sp.]
MKNRYGVFKNLALFTCALTFCCLPMGTVQARSIPDIPLGGQYAISRAIGMGQPDFHIRPQKGGSLLNNTAQHFTASIFDNGGLKIRTRDHHIEMRLTELGNQNQPLQSQPAHAKGSANELTYDHGLFSQWFINGPMGLQQGFTLNQRPARDDPDRLVLALELESDLKPYRTADGRGIDFATEDGKVVFRYSGLMVTDAGGRQLGAYMETAPRQIRLVINDTDARYPVVVDPVFQQAKLTASDGAAGDLFGRSVAVDGQTIVVGAPSGGAHGTAYVFQKTGINWTSMTQTAQLTASDGSSGDYFGSSVAIEKNTIIVGADSAVSSGSTRPGAAYVFIKPVTGWTDMTQTAKLRPQSGEDEDRFGGAVAVAGDTVVVGADGTNTGGTVNQGTAYVFVRPGAGWTNMTQTAQLTADDGAAHDAFGYSVHIYKNTIVVGAPGDQNNQGSVYVFLKPQAGWNDMTQNAKLMASDGAADDNLGTSVRINRDTIVAGAPGFHTPGKTDLGAAYVFVKPGTDWVDMTETAQLKAGDVMIGDKFGRSVAVEDNTIIVGSPYHNYSGTTSSGQQFVTFNMGAMYAFTRPRSGWHDMSAKALMIAGDGARDDSLGWSVDISGETVVGGAAWHDIGTNDNQGAAYIFNFKKDNPWPKFMSAVTAKIGRIVAGNKKAGHPTSGDTTTHRLFIGSFDLLFSNDVIPHFLEDAISFCYIEVPVLGGVAPLHCSSAKLTYDATEDNGGTRIRRKGSVTFNPTGTCNKFKYSCTVQPRGTGSETFWQWYKQGTSWVIVPGMPVTMPIQWSDMPIYFKNIDLINGGCSTVEASTSTGSVTWHLCLVHRP